MTTALIYDYALHGDPQVAPAFQRPPHAGEVGAEDVKREVFDKKSAAESCESKVPAGWPDQLRLPLAWDGAHFLNEGQYTYTLDDKEKLEVEIALQHFKSLGLDGSEVNSQNFPLPSLKTQLLALAVNIHEGKGFFVLRGLNPTDYTPEDNVLMFLGIASYIGEDRRKQDFMGNMLVHVFNDKIMKTPQEDRGAKASNRASVFHTDSACDILALQTLSQAAKGGRTVIASAWKVYNELANSRPDLLHVLADSSWIRNDYGIHRQSCVSPILYHHDGKIILNFSRPALLGLKNSNSERSLTATQIEALDAVHSIAQKHQLILTMTPGDLVFVNNLGILHAREAFEDDDANSRHLVRLWLRNEKLRWKLPPVDEIPWYMACQGDDIEETWEITAVPKLMYRSYWFAPH